MSWIDALPAVRGKLLRDADLAPFTWFRVGGKAELLFLPADHSDLADFLRGLPAEIPLTVLGVGSNVIIRDGGIEGVVIRLMGKAFGYIGLDEDGNIIADAGVLDSMVARFAAKSGIAGLEFYAGIPGAIGGALTMNAGCYGRETKDVLIRAWGYDRSGQMRILSNRDFGYTYRHSEVPEGSIIWVQATFAGTPDDPDAVSARIEEITSRREATQPIREKTGGSTFKNPPGHSSWKLVDEAGWRGKLHGGAKFSELHSNFMINTGEASAKDLEELGELVRAYVKATTGIQLDWEIKRIGKPA